jgi:2-polyprenyl-3-methyl-5-hydroxy-6-metoxy-1,4-benzoquinol methylase
MYLLRSLVVYVLFIIQVSVLVNLMKEPTHVYLLGIRVEKRYKYYDSVKKRMFESMNVTFRETKSYFTLSDIQSNACPVIF